MKFRELNFFLPFFLKYRRQMLIGIAALLLTDAAGLAIPWALKSFIDSLSAGIKEEKLLLIACLILFLSCIQAIARFGWRKYLFGPARLIERDLLNRLYLHFLTLDTSFYQRNPVGDLLSRSTNDLRAVRDFVGLGLLILVDAAVVIVSALALMFWIHPYVTILVLLPLPIVSLLFFKFIKKIGEGHEAVQAHLSDITSHVQENVAGIRTLHTFVQEEFQKQKFDDLNREYIKKNLRVAKLYGIFSPSYIFTLGISALISLWIGGKAALSGEISLGEFVAFNGYLLMLSWPMMGLGYVINLGQKGRVAMGRLLEIFNAKPQINSPQDMAKEIIEFKGSIKLKALKFSYPSSDKPCLNDIDLHIPQGQCLAIVGKVGAGKTSLGNLLLRLYDPQEGSIAFDGLPANEIPLSILRKNVVRVEQEPFLLSMSIKDNIRLGTPSADDAQLNSAIISAGLKEDMEQLPNGVDTIIGERGVSLSGGQKQRVALARALLMKPKILILDDAFSSLDAETESKIMKNIFSKDKSLTLIFITQKFLSARKAEQIVFMKNGMILEKGSHSELMNSNGSYARSYRDQKLATAMEITLQ